MPSTRAIDDEQITAEFFNGLVEITVRDGVSAGAPRRISIRDSSTETETRSLG